MVILRAAGIGQTDLVETSGLKTADIAELPFDKKSRDKAVRAIEDAGKIAMIYFRNSESWEKSPGQTVTKADLEIDHFLKSALPGDGEGWLSEETEDDPARLGKDLVWIVDPIDGTRSFAYGNPEFAISIALSDRQGTLAGWLLNPATGEFMEAVRGQGCFVDGKPVRVSSTASLEAASIIVSSGENRKIGLGDLFAPANIKPLGSLAYKLFKVANGEADAYVTFRTINDWDLAAGILAVREAGGVVVDKLGQKHKLNKPSPTHQGIVASNSTLVPLLMERTRH